MVGGVQQNSIIVFLVYLFLLNKLLLLLLFNTTNVTNSRYIRLTSAEDCLSNFGEFKKTSYSPHQTYFQKRSTSSFIEDDHIPFLKRSK